jgi:hypothetical protein
MSIGNKGFLVIARAALITTALVLATSSVYATEQSQKRQAGRDLKQDTKQDARKAKADCKAADQKSNSDCRQDKREAKQGGREQKRDIKH